MKDNRVCKLFISYLYYTIKSGICTESAEFSMIFAVKCTDDEWRFGDSQADNGVLESCCLLFYIFKIIATVYRLLFVACYGFLDYLFHIIADGNLKDYLTMLAMIPCLHIWSASLKA